MRKISAFLLIGALLLTGISSGGWDVSDVRAAANGVPMAEVIDDSGIADGSAEESGGFIDEGQTVVLDTDDSEKESLISDEFMEELEKMAEDNDLEAVPIDADDYDDILSSYIPLEVTEYQESIETAAVEATPTDATLTDADAASVDPAEDEAAVYDGNEDVLKAGSDSVSYNAMSKNIITSVKDQTSGSELCWAFSAVSAAETSSIINKISSSPNYSEYQLGYFALNSAKTTDPLGLLKGDSNSGGKSYYINGGNPRIAMLAMASGIGVVEEDSNTAFSKASSTSSLDTKYEYSKNAATLKESRAVYNSEISYVKDLVYTYGSVSTGLHYPDSSYESISKYIKKVGSYASLNYTGSVGSNHAVTIIGWDDNYSPDNFVQKPSKSGAWLIKNSWGTANNPYMWVSYEDSSLIEQESYAFNMQKADAYDYNYQYDGSFSSAYLAVPNGQSIANVYTVSGNSKEQLSSVSILLYDDQVSYQVAVYKNPDTGKPASGTKVAEVKSSSPTTYPGLYNIKLPSPVTFSKGDRFSVVFTLSDNGAGYNDLMKNSSGKAIDQSAGTVSVGVGKTGNVYYSDSGEIAYKYVETTAKNQSFYMPSSDRIYDMSDYQSGSYVLRIKAYTKDITPAKTYTAPTVSYRTHVQNVGWQSYVSNGAMTGTSGRSLRLEGINIKLSGGSLASGDLTGGITYRTHVQNIGWQSWVSNNAMAGTSGRSLRLEAIQIKLTGTLADHFDIYYRVHAQNIGWMNWAMNGQEAGTSGYSYRLEALQIVIVKKGEAPASTLKGIKNVTPQWYKSKSGGLVGYRTHVQNDGWQSYRYDGDMSGTSGRSLRLEGINIKLGSTGYSGGIKYRTHVQNIGWQSYVSNGAMSGTSGRSLRLEAIQIELTGAVADHYDIYYRVHAQNIGWMGWAKNGQQAGTAGYSYRLEGIQIMLVRRGENAPASNYGGIKSVTSQCYRSR